MRIAPIIPLLALAALGPAAGVHDPGPVLPGDPVPEFLAMTLNGTSLRVGPNATDLFPLYLSMYDEGDAFSRRTFDSQASLEGFLLEAPLDATYAFFTYSAHAYEYALWVRARLSRSAEGARDPARARATLSRCLFATTPLLEDPTEALGRWAASWEASRAIAVGRVDYGGGLTVVAPPPDEPRPRLLPLPARMDGPWVGGPGGSRGLEERLGSSRLDASKSWNPFPIDGVEAEVVRWFREPEGAAPADPARYAGKVALVALEAPRGRAAGRPGTAGEGVPRPRHRAARPTTPASIAHHLEGLGARAVAFYPPAGLDLWDVTCEGEADCELDVTIPCTSIPRWMGIALSAALDNPLRRNVTLSFASVPGPALYLGVDRRGRASEVGWLAFPTLEHASWAAKWESWILSVDDRLRGASGDGRHPGSSGEFARASLGGSRDGIAWVAATAAEAASPAAHATRLTVFDGSAAFGGSGSLVADNVSIPAELVDLAPGHRLLLEFALGCRGPTDASCPQWDHVVQGFACCGGECDACEPTVWEGPASTPRGSAGRRAAEAARAAQRVAGGAPPPGAGRCGRELGRWITPFRRRVGRWLLDVTAVRGLLGPTASGGASPGGSGSSPPSPRDRYCSFTLQTPGWAGPWVPTMSLHAVPRTEALADDGARSAGGDGARSARAPPPLLAPSGIHRRTPGPRALATLPRLDPATAAPAVAGATLAAQSLGFPGGAFDSGYNSRQGSASVTVPHGATRVLLAALITGHGSDENGCAEFCVTEHVFEISAAPLPEGGAARGRGGSFSAPTPRRPLPPPANASVAFDIAGTELGCTHAVASGSVPNEHGTWEYGRGGWCDGQQVDWTLWDVSEAVLGAGEPRAPPVEREATDAASAPLSPTHVRVRYWGFFNGTDPAPSQAPGAIIIQANLLVETVGGEASRLAASAGPGAATA